jgi:hypothetical protein
MKTVINLRFDKGTKLEKFISENEIDQLDEYDDMFDISGIKFLPRIGESYCVGFEGYGYQKKFLREAEKIEKHIGYLFEEDYKVKDIKYIMGSDDLGDICFIEVLLCVGF